MADKKNPDTLEEAINRALVLKALWDTKRDAVQKATGARAEAVDKAKRAYDQKVAEEERKEAAAKEEAEAAQKELQEFQEWLRERFGVPLDLTKATEHGGGSVRL